MAKLPILPTLQGYKVSWLTADVTAGLTLVAIAIPEQMATAHLANMPAVAGFYAFIAGSLLFALFGRHPRMSVGGDSTIAPVFAAGVAALAATGSATYTHLVSATALIVGALLVAAGLLRLGWIADFFPLPVVTGAARRDRRRDTRQAGPHRPRPARGWHDDDRPGAGHSSTSWASSTGGRSGSPSVCSPSWS